MPTANARINKRSNVKVAPVRKLEHPFTRALREFMDEHTHHDVIDQMIKRADTDMKMVWSKHNLDPKSKEDRETAEKINNRLRVIRRMLQYAYDSVKRVEL